MKHRLFFLYAIFLPLFLAGWFTLPPLVSLVLGGSFVEGLVPSVVEGVFNYAEAQEELPDLVIDAITFNPDTRAPSVTYRNAGNATADLRLPNGDPVRILIQYRNQSGSALDSGLAVPMPIASPGGPSDELSPGESVTRSNIGGSPPAEAVSLRVRVDYGSELTESNETNNEWVGPIITSETTAEDLIDEDEGFVHATTSVSLPGSPLYFFRNLGQGIRTLMTFNPERRAELQLQQASQRITEVRLLAERGDTERAVRHLQRYQRDVENLSERARILERRSPEAGREFVVRLLRSELEHQRTIGQLERRVSTELLTVVKSAREKTLDEVGKTAGRIDKEQLDIALSTAFAPGGSPFKPLRNLEVLKAVEEKVPEQAKDAIRQAQENSLKRFKNQLEALPEGHRKLITGYVEKAGGDETLYLKTFDDLNREGVKAEATEEVLAAKEKVFGRLENRLKEVIQKDPSRAKDIFFHLKDGSADDLRILREIEVKLDPRVAGHLTEVKKEAEEKFVAKIKDPQFLEKEIKRTADIKQIALLEEFKFRVSPKEREGIEKAKNELAESIAEKLKGAKSDEERHTLAKVVTSDDPEGLEIIGKTFEKDKSTRDVLLKTQLENVKSKIGRTQEAGEAERISQKLHSKNVKAFVERLEPKLLSEVREKTAIGQLIQSLQKARLSLESSKLLVERAPVEEKRIIGSEKVGTAERNLAQTLQDVGGTLSLLRTSEEQYAEVIRILSHMREMAGQAAVEQETYAEWRALIVDLETLELLPKESRELLAGVLPQLHDIILGTPDRARRLIDIIVSELSRQKPSGEIHRILSHMREMAGQAAVEQETYAEWRAIIVDYEALVRESFEVRVEALSQLGGIIIGPPEKAQRLLDVILSILSRLEGDRNLILEQGRQTLARAAAEEKNARLLLEELGSAKKEKLVPKEKLKPILPVVPKEAAPAPKPTLPAILTSIVHDNFNSYESGRLVGQGGWSSHKNGENFVVVQGPAAYEGGKAVYVKALADSVAVKSGNALPDGRQSVYIKTENRANWGHYGDGNAQFRVSKGIWVGSAFVGVTLRMSGEVTYYNPISDAYENFARYNDNEWTLIEIEWRSSDKKARYRVNNQTWTDWKPFWGSDSFTDFDHVGFDFILPGGSGGVYYDFLSSGPTPPSPPPSPLPILKEPMPVPSPVVCPKEYVPVCGTDSKTYTNKCFAAESKVGIAYSEECKVVTPTPPPTTECTKEYFPVCGTDNKTYTNACWAKQSGVGVQYSGECKVTTPPPAPPPTTVVYQCSDGVDNDKDGYIDLKDPGCTDEKDNDETNVVSPPPPATVVKPTISSFTVSSTAITKGQSVTLYWSTADATSVILGPTKETLTASGKKVITPTLTITYTITATNAAGSASASVIVTVK